MSKCKGYIHFDVCRYTDKPGEPYSTIVQDVCEHFLDKSGVSLLPCNVGDKIWRAMRYTKTGRRALQYG